MGVGGRNAGTVQDVIHAVTAAEREGPEQEEKTMRGQPRSKEWGEAPMLATRVRGISLEKLCGLEWPRHLLENIAHVGGVT